MKTVKTMLLLFVMIITCAASAQKFEMQNEHSKTINMALNVQKKQKLKFTIKQNSNNDFFVLIFDTKNQRDPIFIIPVVKDEKVLVKTKREGVEETQPTCLLYKGETGEIILHSLERSAESLTIKVQCIDQKKPVTAKFTLTTI